MRTSTFLTTLSACLTFWGSTVFADAPRGVVIAKDLQHHRWVLTSINGEPLPADVADGMVPELDFGENLHVSGNTGCNRLTGQAELDGGWFQIPNMASTRRLCSPVLNELEQRVQSVLSNRSTIELDADNNLTLASDRIRLRFRLSDWVD